MNHIRIELLPWLSQYFAPHKSGRYVLDAEIEPGRDLGELFARLAREHPVFAERVFDPDERQMREHVEVVVNDILIELRKAPAYPLRDGDVITLIPAFQGG